MANQSSNLPSNHEKNVLKYYQDLTESLKPNYETKKIKFNPGEYTPKKGFSLVCKYVPFVLLVLASIVLLSGGLFLLIKDPINTWRQGISALVFLVVFLLPLTLLGFSYGYSFHNKKHSDWMKKKLARLVHPTSKNGCFPLRMWYLTTNSISAWELNGMSILNKFKELNPQLYDLTIKYYREY